MSTKQGSVHGAHRRLKFTGNTGNMGNVRMSPEVTGNIFDPGGVLSASMVLVDPGGVTGTTLDLVDLTTDDGLISAYFRPVFD